MGGDYDFDSSYLNGGYDFYRALDEQALHENNIREIERMRQTNSKGVDDRCED